MSEKLPSNLHFIHANGYLPKSYKNMFMHINKKVISENYFLENLKNTKFDNWIPFHDDFIKTIKKQNKPIIGMGHSIGGNIILRSSITHPELFQSIVLLDPTLFASKIMFLWKIFYSINLQHLLHPWMKSTLNRKMVYQSQNDIFNSYRNKHIFSKINDENLKNYIESITKTINNKIYITYPKEFEYQIYKTGLIADNFIWNNIKNLQVPTLIIRAEKSNAFLLDASKKVSQLNNQIKIVTLEKATHLFPLEIPKETAEIVLDFIS